MRRNVCRSAAVAAQSIQTRRNHALRLYHNAHDTAALTAIPDAPPAAAGHAAAGVASQGVEIARERRR